MDTLIPATPAYWTSRQDPWHIKEAESLPVDCVSMFRHVTLSVLPSPKADTARSRPVGFSLTPALQWCANVYKLREIWTASDLILDERNSVSLCQVGTLQGMESAMGHSIGFLAKA